MCPTCLWSAARSPAGRRLRFDSRRGTDMTRRTLKTAAVCLASFAVILVNSRLEIVQGQQKKTPGEGFAAIPGLKGGQDIFGPYDPVEKWPKPLSESLPNHEGWTWSQSTYVFPASHDRA